MMPDTLRLRGVASEPHAPHPGNSSSEVAGGLLDCYLCGKPIEGRVVRLSGNPCHDPCALAWWGAMIDAMDEEDDAERARR